MTKRIEVSDRIMGLIAKQVGAEVDSDKVAVYECVAASTRPISQRRTSYNGAVMSKSYLDEAVAFLASETVPIHIMHNNAVLPIGKVIEAGVVEADQGHHDLRVMFYVEAEGEHADKIDLGIIDEVSVGMLPEHAYCSECGFDYMAPGNEMSMYWGECDEGHVIGDDGIHLRLVGLSDWMELSLVGKGASNKPKILAPSESRLGKERFERLAANKGLPELSYLFCSSTKQGKKEPEMELDKLIDQLTDLKASQKALESEKAVADEALTAAKADIEKLQGENEALKADLAKVQDEDKDAELAASKEKSEKLESFVAKQFDLAATAAGIEKPENPTTEQMLEGLEAAQVKLAAIPRGGVSEPAGSDVSLNASRAAAFATK